MEDKDPNALQGVKDGEGVGKVYVVECQVEEAEDPCAAEQAHDDTDSLHVGDDHVTIVLVTRLEQVGTMKNK